MTEADLRNVVGTVPGVASSLVEPVSMGTVRVSVFVDRELEGIASLVRERVVRRVLDVYPITLDVEITVRANDGAVLAAGRSRGLPKITHEPIGDHA